MANSNKIDIFKELILCTSGVELKTYHSDMALDNTGEMDKDAQLLDGLLSISKNKDHILDYLKDNSDHYPIVLSDEFGLVWIACFEKREGTIEKIYLLGPVYTTENSFANIKHKLDEHDYSMRAKHYLVKKLQKIPTIMSNLYFQYALMLHYCLNNQKIDYSDIQYNSTADTALKTKDLKDVPKHHGVWQAEQRLLSMVENGNLNYKKILSDTATMSYGVKFDVGNPLRQAQVSVLTFNTLCCRAAIRGGLSSETAYTLSDYYAQCIENAKHMSDVGVLSHTMYEDYIMRVHKLKNSTVYSSAIQTCRDYIELHVTDELSVSELATYVGYTDYYLTRKFKQETGVSIINHIQNVRIRHAMLLLSSSDHSIQEISDMLHFCSRSYFSDVFHKVTGASPKEFRKANQKM